ncbi:MAG: hypothetical protein ACUVSW_13915 [Roseiflexus sp.]
MPRYPQLSGKEGFRGNVWQTPDDHAAGGCDGLVTFRVVAVPWWSSQSMNGVREIVNRIRLPEIECRMAPVCQHITAVGGMARVVTQEQPAPSGLIHCFDHRLIDIE